MDLFRYFTQTAHLLYLFAYESAFALYYLPVSLAGEEIWIFQWPVLILFLLYDKFVVDKKPWTNIFSAFSSRKSYHIGLGMISFLYLYLIYEIWSACTIQGIHWKTYTDALQLGDPDVEEYDKNALYPASQIHQYLRENAKLLWWFWMVKVATVWWRKEFGEPTKGIYYLLFWFISIRYEPGGQLLVLVFMECLRSFALIFVIDILGLYLHINRVGFEFLINWLFDSLDLFIFLTCYVNSYLYPVFAFMNMALYNAYLMVAIFFLGNESFLPLFTLFIFYSFVKKLQRALNAKKMNSVNPGKIV